jgi:choline-sulfatase
MPKQRNVLLICTDEYRGDMLAANGLNPDICTPHMDALAQRGVNAPRHFTTFPKCVPARISMMTGRHTHTDGYRDITKLMPHGTPDLASTLQGEGYELVEFNRNHCWENMLDASHTPPELEPGQKGIRFDHHAWTAEFKPIYERHRSREKFIERVHPQGLERGEGFVNADDRNWSADYAATEMAEHYLETVRNPDRPFFCQVNLGKPHTPYETSESWFSMYDTLNLTRLPDDLPSDAPYCVERQRAVRTGNGPDGLYRAIQTTYMGMCSRIDTLAGQIVAAVDRLGLFEDTLVIFTSDHGDYAGQYGLVEKWDNHFADCLMHVPMIFAGADLPAGQTLAGLSSHADLAPTICDLLGIEPFAGIHGRSLRPAFNGQRVREAVFGNGGHESAMRERFNFYETKNRPAPEDTPESFNDHRKQYPSVGDGKQETYRLFPETMARAKMVRTDRWKYVHRETGDHEFYDLEADRWELNNLFPHADAQHKQAISDLRAKLLDWTLQTDPDRPYVENVGA